MRFKQKQKRTLALVLLLAVALAFTGIPLLMIVNDGGSTTTTPTYDVIIIGESLDPSVNTETWKMTTWAWNEVGTTLTISEVEAWAEDSNGGINSKSAFQSATVRGDLTFVVYDIGRNFEVCRVAWWSKTDQYELGNIQFDRTPMIISSGEIYRHSDVWDTTSVPDGEYVVQLQASTDGATYDKTLLIWAFGDGQNSAPIDMMLIVALLGVGLVAFLVTRGKRKTR